MGIEFGVIGEEAERVFSQEEGRPGSGPGEPEAGASCQAPAVFLASREEGSGVKRLGLPALAQAKEERAAGARPVSGRRSVSQARGAGRKEQELPRRVQMGRSS